MVNPHHLKLVLIVPLHLHQLGNIYQLARSGRGYDDRTGQVNRAVCFYISITINTFYGDITSIEWKYNDVEAFEIGENKKYKLSLGKQRKITKNDVESLFEEGKARVKTDGYEVIGYSEIFFALDDNRKVENPIGVVSSMLGGAITYYLCENYYLQTIRKILNKSKVKDVRFVFVGQAMGNYLLSKEDRESPSLLLDVGYITSEMTVHLGNGILAECSEDFGGGILTYHMVKEFDLEVMEGELLKREINFALNPSVKSSYTIELEEKTLDFSSEKVNEIAFSVVDSFLGSVSEFLEQNTPLSMENLRVYLTGGGLSYLRGIKSHLSARLGSPVEIITPNILLNSNASSSVRQKARQLMDYLEEPVFDSKFELYSFQEVSKDLYLYQDCYVIWSGRVTNVNSNEKYFNADLLVGYEDMKKIEGIAHLRISSEISVNPEKPLKVLGKISIEDGSLILLGKAIYQPLTGDKL